MPLKGYVVLVTGAARGIGRGTALQFGAQGATVYITGRKPTDRDQVFNDFDFPTLETTAREVESRGGKCYPIYCNHAMYDEVEEVFKTIKENENGRLDVLVNAAWMATTVFSENQGKSFWEVENPEEYYDAVNNVGLRNNYLCATEAAKLMVPRKSGFIVNVSSAGGAGYMYSVSYGLGKAAKDKMMSDMAFELKEHNVTAISVWPGAVKTEVIDKFVYPQADHDPETKQMRMMFDLGETVEFTGVCLVALFKDRNFFKHSGKILTTEEIGKSYGLKDVNGRVPFSYPKFKEYLRKFLDPVNEARDPAKQMT